MYRCVCVGGGGVGGVGGVVWEGLVVDVLGVCGGGVGGCVCRSYTASFNTQKSLPSVRFHTSFFESSQSQSCVLTNHL